MQEGPGPHTTMDTEQETPSQKPLTNEPSCKDEARVGQKGTLEYIWAPVGSRPRAVRDNRHDSVYLFGALCAYRAVGAAVIMPAANSEAMSVHLKEISTQVSPGAHAVLVCDGAGWHQRGDKLTVPDNITLLPLPAYSPELNPMENVWDYLRGNKLSHTGSPRRFPLGSARGVCWQGKQGDIGRHPAACHAGASQPRRRSGRRARRATWVLISCRCRFIASVLAWGMIIAAPTPRAGRSRRTGRQRYGGCRAPSVAASRWAPRYSLSSLLADPGFVFA